MNLALRGERYRERVILHEFGHALSLAHEHQNPAVSIQWNETVVIAEYKRTQGWTEEEIRDYVLTPLAIDQTNFTRFDPQSIMLYPISNRWTIGDFETGYNRTLSATDKSFISTLYSGRPPDPRRPPLRPISETPPGMVLIPAGEFQMGSIDAEAVADENPLHTVYVDAFYMDKYEVTNAEYKKFVDANPQWQKSRIPISFHDGGYLGRWNGNNYPTGKANHPVVDVSWYAAMAYSKWAGKRLPTEAEWEKSARGGKAGLKYPWGNTISSGHANYGNNVKGTSVVGSYSANGYGLYDMAGNVWEWCLDAYDGDFYSSSPRRNPLRNPLGGVNTLSDADLIINDYTNVELDRVLRGGSWASIARYVRVAFRSSTLLASTGGSVGFRCARDAVTP